MRYSSLPLAHPPRPTQFPPPFTPEPVPELVPATFVQRAAALLIDWVILGALASIVAAFIARLGGASGSAQFMLHWFYRPLSVFLVTLAANVVPHALTGQSLGKRALRLRVVCAQGRERIGLSDALGREVARVLSILSVFGCALALGGQRRALHDYLVETSVVRDG